MTPEVLTSTVAFAPVQATPQVARGTSIRRRTSLIIGVLLTAMAVTTSWLAYREVERALRVNGHERVSGVAGQWADLFAQSTSARTLEMRRLVGDADVQQLVLASDMASLPPPPAILKATLGRTGQTVVWLYGADGRALARLLQRQEHWSAPDAADLRVPPDGIGPLIAHSSVVWYRTTASISGVSAGGAPAGFLSIERSITSSTARGQMERLIGSGAVLKLGNTTGDLWTNLSEPVPAPPVAAVGEPSRYTSSDGLAHLGTAVKVSGTPWLIWVEFPEAALMQPAKTLVARLMPIMSIVILIGALTAYVVAARITTPLEHLARAAEAIAAGDYSRRVVISRRDETAVLGRAFNLMADRVNDSHQALEARVQGRTVELEQAMTSLRETQAELVRRERMATLGQLASSVGHELRNPLGVMTNAVYYLKMIQADAPEQVRQYLGILRHQIGLAEKIVGDLLDYARLKTPQRQVVDVKRLIEEQLARLGPVSNVDAEAECPEALSVDVDPVQIGQVMLNLLTNAQQAMEAGGGTMTIRGRSEGNEVVIDVIDTGPGVPPDLLDKIFEPLFTTKARGIGLGLAVSRTLAQSNGGGLTVSSAPGQGATFSLTLPASTRRSAS